MKRTIIRELVEKHLIQEVSIAKQQHPFKAILMTGPAGAGKTFTAKNLLGISDYIRKFSLNTDEIVEFLFPKFDVTLKFAHGKADPLAQAQAQLRNIAKVGTYSKAAGFINRGKPLFIDTTGEDPAAMTPVLDQLIDLGYDVGIIKVFVPEETSTQRDIARERTVGAYTAKIWGDYEKNVIAAQGYDKYAEGKPHVKVLNPEPFWNVFNLSDKDVYGGEDEDGNKKLIAKARSKVEDVEGEFPVSIEEVDRVIADLKKAVGMDSGGFLEPYTVPNPIGASFYKGMLALLQHTKGRYGQEITDFYKALVYAPNIVERSPEVLEAIQTLESITGSGEITDEETLIKSLEKFKSLRHKAGRGKEKRLTVPLARDILKDKGVGSPDGLSSEPQRRKERAATKVASKKFVQTFEKKFPKAPYTLYRPRSRSAKETIQMTKILADPSVTDIDDFEKALVDAELWKKFTPHQLAEAIAKRLAEKLKIR